MGYQDNVATALYELPQGSMVKITGIPQAEGITLKDHIPCGHKFALRDIPAGTAIVKNNIIIAESVQLIIKGSWVHTHNLQSLWDSHTFSGQKNDL
jgi:altronate dehydratase